MGNLITKPTNASTNDSINASTLSASITTQPTIDEYTASNIISKQNLIITTLRNQLKELEEMSRINIKESFSNSNVNIDLTSFKAQKPILLPLINQSNQQELNSYIQTYNKEVSLLDDPIQLADVSFNVYKNIQDRKIQELKNAISSFPTNANLQPKPIRSLKNIKTSTSLNVEQYNKDSNNVGSIYNKYPNYLIYGNNGCLQYDSLTNENTPSNSWSFEPCHSNKSSQRFNISKIDNINDYNAKIATSNLKSHKIEDSNSAIFGFYVVNPENDSSQCIQINNEGLSVMPCSLDSSQRFKTYYHTIQP